MNSSDINESVVDVQFFALARELTGVAQVSIDVFVASQQMTIADLRSALIVKFPRLAPLSSRLLFAVGTQYATENTVIPPRATVACFPPVSGG